ncbi:oligopeptide transporter 8 [Colletotrichum abscissum]|uniref:Oligopeptide transporter 8 n=1 Tax=Colletotrichum abscissum TaxID=1671311 RepID=A0A9P9X2R3_9PEZI|nr:oligopeptide transporter 8 [Colletotrichum abscissum]KAI3533453.1 oligopeptide transporter 8 [Colletotrichum abscissum]KAK1475732.1 oligopeptide transporter 8 [Colletotrichum abscissum]
MAGFGKSTKDYKDSTLITATALDAGVPSPAAGASNDVRLILEDDKSDDGLKTTDPERHESDDERKLVNGGVVIRDGNDVARYVVSTQDDGDASCTFRSFIIGSGLTALAACINQIYFYKPVDVSFASVFLCLMAYVIGVAWSVVLPRRQHVEKYLPSQAKWLGPVVHFINPGHFGLKEHAVASILSTSSGNGAAIVQVFGAERLFYNRSTDPATAILTVFSASIFGYGLVGILRSIIVHPSEMVWWQCLPMISIYQTLHREPEGNNKDRLRVFGFTSIGMFIWEPIVSYVWPWLNGISIPCLASMKAAPPTRKILMTIFGGINSNEGQGIFNFSLDWQYITSRYMSLPLLQQANSWVGIVLSYIMCFSFYYGGAWGAKKFPFMSTAMFDGKTGKVYNQTAVFGQNAILDTEALEVHGLPRLTASNIWANMAAMAAIGALLTHIALFYGPLIKRSLKQAWKKEETDIHYKIMQENYKDVPIWWYIVILLVGFFTGLGAVIKGHTTLDAWAYVCAILLGCIVAPFSLCLYGLLGTSVATNNLSKMLCGVLQPGKPVANLYFSMFSHEVTVLSVFLSTDLKMAQYLKIPWRTMFILQTWGSLFGTALNYVIMDTIVANRREILLDPIGTQVWSGRKIQSLNTTAVTWSLVKYVYGFGKDGYGWIPLSIVIGAAIPVALWLVSKKYKTIYGWEISKFVTPVILHNASETTSGTTSVIWSQVLVGLWSQWYIRLRHPAWFGKYNYIVGGGLDAGAKVMMFILTFAVAGGSGKEVPFPMWWGNPESSSKQYADYCGTG